jgi:uridylate kinase
MLATVINALTLQDALERNYDVDTRTQSAINVQQVAEPYIRRRAIRHLEKGRVVLFASGLGSPFMTTDTAAALRVTEIDAEILLMAKHGVDGVYESDPNTNPNASRLDFITYRDAITKRLGVMDTTALSLCEENNIPIVVFDLFVEGSIERIISGERVGSLVAETEPIPAG